MEELAEMEDLKDLEGPWGVDVGDPYFTCLFQSLSPGPPERVGRGGETRKEAIWSGRSVLGWGTGGNEGLDDSGGSGQRSWGRWMSEIFTLLFCSTASPQTHRQSRGRRGD